MNKQIKKKWHDLNDLVFDLNHSGFHVFIEYAGHTNTFSVHFYYGGFSQETPASRLDLVTPMTVDGIDKTINWLCKNYK